MGNGPSLTTSLANCESVLKSYDLVAVNFMGLSSEYLLYKPGVYILCDPAFWFKAGDDEIRAKVKRLFETIANKTDWDLQMYFPYQAAKSKEVREIRSLNNNIKLHFYNKTKFEGYVFLNRWVYKKQWGMPRAQNVLIAALMLAIFSNYKEIYLLGAENNFFKDLWVDEKNNLRYNFYHFYKEKTTETDSVIINKGYKLYHQLASFYFAFKSYVDVEMYAKKRGVKIYNSTPDSYIDAFDRKPIQ